MEYGIGQNPKWATVFKDKISNIKNTKISSGLKMAVSVGCMWGGNACGHGTTVPTGQLLLAKDCLLGASASPRIGPITAAEDLGRLGCECWRAALAWEQPLCKWISSHSPLSIWDWKRENWWYFRGTDEWSLLLNSGHFFITQVKVQLPQRRQGKRQHVICFIALG